MSEKSGKSKAALSKAQISREISYDLPINELLVRFENSKSQSPSENTNIFAFEKSFGVSVEALYASKDMRLDHLALQLTANRLGRIAPFFRNRIVDLHRDGIWKLSDHGARQNRDPSEIQYFRDMLLVDAHWILCRRLESQLEPWQRNISIPFYTDYFRLTKGHGQINWYGLKKFVASPYTTSSRVKNFGMTYLEQVHCSILEGRENRDYKFWVFLDKTVQELLEALELVVKKSYRRGKVESLEILVSQWQMLCLAGWSAAEAAKLDILRLGICVQSNGIEFRRLRDSFASRKRWFLRQARLEEFKFDPKTAANTPKTPRPSSLPMPGSRRN